jgi:cytochrome c-type biogenesis protein CcmH/NrfG
MARFGRHEFSAAAEAWEASFAADPTNVRIAFLLGWAYAGAGDDRLAIGAWRNAARLDPTLVPAHLALAETFVRRSEPALAVQALRFGLSAVPNSPELLDRLARLERR